MPYKKKANPGTVQFDKLIAELPEQRENIKAQVQFRHDLLASQKHSNYKNEFDRLQGAKKTTRIGCQHKAKNERITKEGKAITERRTISSYLFF